MVEFVSEAKKIAVIGAGSWGTALSLVLSDNGHDVTLWARRKEHAEELNERRTNEKYLPGVSLPQRIRATSSLKEAVKTCDLIFFVVPTKAARDVLSQLNGVIEKPLPFVHATKGIEPERLKTVSTIIQEEIEPSKRTSISVLSGPSHAEEVALRQPTTVTVASTDESSARFVQDLLINKHFRVYTNQDMIGVELGGALKNIIALGAGLSDGIGFGDNAKAALMTRGLAEIARLGIRAGANPLTFAGLAGLGDLIVTCTSKHSRNWRAGHLLGKGKTIHEVLKEMGMVVEGIRTTKAAHALAKKEGIEMPITAALYRVLFENEEPKVAVERLMNRGKTDEIDDLADLYAARIAERRNVFPSERRNKN